MPDRVLSRPYKIQRVDLTKLVVMAAMGRSVLAERRLKTSDKRQTCFDARELDPVGLAGRAVVRTSTERCDAALKSEPDAMNGSDTLWKLVLEPSNS